MSSMENRPSIEESPKWQFRRNLVRLLKLKKMTHADLAEMTDMSEWFHCTRIHTIVDER